ncbi:hypothetical protein BGX21_008549 [Mortierella sp. AD011]|nr:hypothetical protein BGX20_005240 [Mortierella sp. AD010]KAF9402829.1 hypothetical protein BGX21_008549 [Mortierella sp. AD011]
MSADSFPPSQLTTQCQESKGAPPMLVLDIKLVETNSIMTSSSASSSTPLSTPEVLTLDSDQETTMTASASNDSDLGGTASSISLVSATGSSLGVASGTSTELSTNAPQDTTATTDSLPVKVQEPSSQPSTQAPEAAPNSQADAHEHWPEPPRQYLERIKETVSKAELGDMLSKESDPFHQAVLRVHMESFDFKRDPIDLALRKFLLDFHFPKEAQQIDRVLEAFANRYHTCNPHLFRSSDVVYTVAFSLMLLHTDAHNKNVRYKMTKEQYVRQAKSIDGVNTIPADILEVLYDNITFLKFVYAEDDMDVDGQRVTEVHSSLSGSWFPRRRTASSQRTDSYSMIRHGSIAHLAPDLSDLIPFRWPYYWKGTIEMVDNVQINNQFTRAAHAPVPGLRSHQPSHQLSSSGSSLQTSFGSRSIRSDTINSYDCDFRDVQRELQQRTTHSSEKDGEDDTDSCVQIRVVKSGILSRKIDVENGKKSSVRGWRDLGIILSGSQLLFFTDLGWFQQQRASQIGFNPTSPPEIDGYFAPDLAGIGPPPMPQALISTMDSIAVVDSSYQKYPHVFRLVCPNGKQYLFRADSEHEMNDWMAKINYASAFKTAGVRLRNHRVSWAKDVIWVKDEQGRHQLRRRKPDHPITPEPLDTRTQLIQAKMKDIDRQINTCSASLAAELRLARGLEVMIPLQNSTRQKIVQSATVVGKRLRQLMLERTKLDCFRTILERDLAVVPAEDDHLGHTRQEFGLGLQLSDGLSGVTEYSRASLGSGTLRTQYEYNVHGYGDFNRPLSLKKEQRGPNICMNEHMDHAREEYVPESGRTSQSNNQSLKGNARPKLSMPDFQRSFSEDNLGDGSHPSPIKDADIPLAPTIIQAAIINAARGNHGNHNNANSTMSSPDLNHYQTPQLSSGSATGTAAAAGHSDTQRVSDSLSPPPKGQSFLSPDSNSVHQRASRSRALSMPGQRPTMMPRTVSIYSSSSQTANRLRRIFEQGLGHFKFSLSSSSSSAKGSATPLPQSTTTSALGGSSLKTSMSFQIDTDDGQYDSDDH